MQITCKGMKQKHGYFSNLIKNHFYEIILAWLYFVT